MLKIIHSVRYMISGVREVLAGIKATRQLLKGSKPILSSRKGRSDYVKQGDYGTAIGDFFALRPSDIQDIKHSNVWTTHNMNTSILINPRDHKTRNHRKTPSLIDLSSSRINFSAYKDILGTYF